MKPLLGRDLFWLAEARLSRLQNRICELKGQVTSLPEWIGRKQIVLICIYICILVAVAPPAKNEKLVWGLVENPLISTKKSKSKDPLPNSRFYDHCYYFLQYVSRKVSSPDLEK